MLDVMLVLAAVIAVIGIIREAILKPENIYICIGGGALLILATLVPLQSFISSYPQSVQSAVILFCSTLWGIGCGIVVWHYRWFFQQLNR
ncbi:hypothetical protein LQM11_004816 [Vibrio parahaemolyticus]|nr:hypothetical protein [Vibrio parahaemolyticus]